MNVIARALPAAGSVIASLIIAACAASSSTTSMSPGASSLAVLDMSAPLVTAPSPDPRVGLKAGLQDALLPHRVVPVAHGFGDLLQILNRGLQRDGALRADQLNARIQVFVNLAPDIFRPLREQRLGIVDIADQRYALLHNTH